MGNTVPAIIDWRCYKPGDLNPHLSSFGSRDILANTSLASYSSNPMSSIGEAINRAIRPDITRGTKSSSIKAVVLGGYVVEGREALSYNMNIESSDQGALANRVQILYIRVPELANLPDPYCKDNIFTPAQTAVLVEMHPTAVLPNFTSVQPSIVAGSIVEVEFSETYSRGIVTKILEEATSFETVFSEISAKNAFIASGNGTFLEGNKAAKASCPASNFMNEIIRIAEEYDIPVEAIETIRRVESGKDPAAIRFEPHVFKRKRPDLVSETLSGEAGFAIAIDDRPVPYTPSQTYCPPARNGLCSPDVSYVASETNRTAFNRAYKHDKMNAVISTSFGYFQVVPEIHEVEALTRKKGEAAAQEFYNLTTRKPEFMSYELLRLWFKRPDKAGAITAAQEGDWYAFSYEYNGPTAAKQGYDQKFEQTYTYLLSQRCFDNVA